MFHCGRISFLLYLRGGVGCDFIQVVIRIRCWGAWVRVWEVVRVCIPFGLTQTIKQVNTQIATII